MVLYRLPIEKKLIALTANAEDEGVPGRSAAPYTCSVQSACEHQQRSAARNMFTFCLIDILFFVESSF